MMMMSTLSWRREWDEWEREKEKERDGCSLGATVLFCCFCFCCCCIKRQTTNSKKKVKTPNNNWFQFSCLLFCSVVGQNVCCFLPSALASVLLLFRCSVVASTHLSFDRRVFWALSAFCHTDRLLTTAATTKLFLQFLVFQCFLSCTLLIPTSFSSSLSSSFFLCFFCVANRTHQPASASAHLLQRRWFLALLYCRLAVAGASFSDFSTNLPVGTTTTFTIPGLLPSAHYCGLRTLLSLLSSVTYAVCCTALLWMWFIGGPDRLTIIMFRRMLPVLSHKL